MKLFIAEKPSVAKAIAEQLGTPVRKEGYWISGDNYITNCAGHLFEMAPPDAYSEEYKRWVMDSLPIIPDAWKLQPKEQTKKQLKIIGELLKRSDVDMVIHAGDPDNEGQLLVDDVLEHFKNRKPTYRFWVSAQDPVSIRNGLQALKLNKEYQGYGLAAKARQRADWLIGMNFTRAYTLLSQAKGHKGTTTIGRVQTPTLALVVKRDREIENFVPIPYYVITATVNVGTGQLLMRWNPKEGQPGLDEENRLINPQAAQELVNKVFQQTGKITQIKREKKQNNQPKGFSLTGITLKASSLYGYGAETVLKICQSLYERHKILTYPRTDCDYLPESQHELAPTILATIAANVPALQSFVDAANPNIKSPIWNDKKITAHHAIIPTVLKCDLNNLTVQERNVYMLVVQNYLAQFFPAYQYWLTTIDAVIEDELFCARGADEIEKGWKALFRNEAQNEEEDIQSIPAIEEGQDAACNNIEAKPTKTKPPKRFTEATLQLAMENIYKYVDDADEKALLKEGDGIGTSATRATIISELLRREFLEADKKFIISTESGRRHIDQLPLTLKSPAVTAAFQTLLSEIKDNAMTVDDFLLIQKDFVIDQIVVTKKLLSNFKS